MSIWPRVPIETEKNIRMCFGCGPDNPIGLKMSFTWDGSTATAEFTPDECHQGWAGVVHGGIIGCLLDEAMTYVPFFSGIDCVTAKMELRIRRPVPLNERLLISASITRNSRKLIETRGAISLVDGTLMAESKATMYVVNNKRANADTKHTGRDKSEK